MKWMLVMGVFLTTPGPDNQQPDFWAIQNNIVSEADCHELAYRIMRLHPGTGYECVPDTAAFEEDEV